MSKRELSRAEIMQRLLDKLLSQPDAAGLLDLSVRQVKRLLRSYRIGGASALISKRRGKPSNHQLPEKLKLRALSLIRTRYFDFGPTPAREKLNELHGLRLSVETARQLMIGSELLDIKVICANTPQAKGRVERVNQTPQDRPVEEMRLRGIASIDQANGYVAEFIAEFDARLAVAAKSEADAHRRSVVTDKLGKVLRVMEGRVLSKNLQLSYNRVIYQIVSKRPRYALRYQRVFVCENSLGEVEIEYKGKALGYQVYHRQQRQSEVADSKQVEAAGASNKPKEKRGHRQVPPEDSPWGRFRLAGSRPPKPIKQK